MYFSGLGDAVADALAPIMALPWETPWPSNPYNAAQAVVVGRQNGVFQSLGYNGPNWTQETFVPYPGGEGGTYQSAPHPDVLAFLARKGLTMKIAHTGTNENGATHTGLFDASGKLVAYGADKFTNKAFEIGKKLTLALIGGMAAGAALTAAGVVGSGTSAAGAATATPAAAAPAAAVPAATAVAPVVSAVAPSVATGGAVSAGAAALLPSAATVVKAIPAVTSVVKAVQAVQGRQTQVAAQQMPIAPPASMVTPPPSTLVPGQSQFDPTIFHPQSQMPPWLIPALLGGGALLLVMMGRRPLR